MYKKGDKIKGLTLLQTPKNTKDFVDCIDDEGYKYYLTIDVIKDRRTIEPDKWNKNNPFKPYNMRLYASTVQEDVCILSTDEELREATTKKVKFRCPRCGKIYEKKWCHWRGQPDNVHWCYDCMVEYRSYKHSHTYEELKELYAKEGYELLSDYDYYEKNGKSYARMHCLYKDGYKYAINLYSLRGGTCGGNNAFSGTNPFAVENLQKFCDSYNLGITILSYFRDEKDLRDTVKIKCRCGNIFTTLPYKITSFQEIACDHCKPKKSSYEYLVADWLKSNKINYNSEYCFSDCKSVNALRFDFKCNYNDRIILIEADGKQHFEEVEFFNSDTLKERKERDEIKNKYCKENNLTLVRIPYWEFTNGNYINILNQTFFG